jgi:hypothetical protein
MKRTKLILWLFVAFCTFGLLSTTVFSALLTYHTKLPFTDGTDDIYYNTTGSETEFDGQGDFIDWIDVLTVNITGANIIIKFQSSGSRSGHNYSCYLIWDLDGDHYHDIIILYSNSYGGYVMQNQIYGHPEAYYFWTGSSWSMYMATMPSTDSGEYLTLKTVWNAFNALGYNLANLDFMMLVYYSEGNFTYAEFAPDETSGGIPGFNLISVLLPVLAVGSLTLINRYRSSKSFFSSV